MTWPKPRAPPPLLLPSLVSLLSWADGDLLIKRRPTVPGASTCIQQTLVVTVVGAWRDMRSNLLSSTWYSPPFHISPAQKRQVGPSLVPTSTCSIWAIPTAVSNRLIYTNLLLNVSDLRRHQRLSQIAWHDKDPNNGPTIFYCCRSVYTRRQSN